MSKHKLQKIIEEKIGSLNEEVEIGTNVNALSDKICPKSYPLGGSAR
jgi:hypothetical protein